MKKRVKFFCVVADGECNVGVNAIKLMNVLFPESKDVEVTGDRLGGAFNSVAILRGVKEHSDLVLRTRRPEPLSNIMFENITATLTMVQDLKLSFAVPRLIHIDATTNNPMERQYWLQSRVPGVALSEVIDDLTTPQRVFLAQEVARCMTAIHKAQKFRYCGGFVRNPSNGDIVIGSPYYFQRVQDERTAGYFEYIQYDPEPPSNVYTFLKKCFESVVESSKQPQFTYFWKVAEQKLQQFGPRRDSRNRLVHTDFYPRNILVTLTGFFFFMCVVIPTNETKNTHVFVFLLRSTTNHWSCGLGPKRSSSS